MIAMRRSSARFMGMLIFQPIPPQLIDLQTPAGQAHGRARGIEPTVATDAGRSSRWEACDTRPIAGRDVGVGVGGHRRMRVSSGRSAPDSADDDFHGGGT